MDADDGPLACPIASVGEDFHDPDLILLPVVADDHSSSDDGAPMPVDRLCNDEWGVILSFVPMSTLLLLRFVSRNVRDIATSDVTWRPVFHGMVCVEIERAVPPPPGGQAEEGEAGEEVLSPAGADERSVRSLFSSGDIELEEDTEPVEPPSDYLDISRDFFRWCVRLRVGAARQQGRYDEYRKSYLWAHSTKVEDTRFTVEIVVFPAIFLLGVVLASIAGPLFLYRGSPVSSASGWIVWLLFVPMCCCLTVGIGGIFATQILFHSVCKCLHRGREKRLREFVHRNVPSPSGGGGLGVADAYTSDTLREARTHTKQNYLRYDLVNDNMLFSTDWLVKYIAVGLLGVPLWIAGLFLPRLFGFDDLSTPFPAYTLCCLPAVICPTLVTVVLIFYSCYCSKKVKSLSRSVRGYTYAFLAAGVVVSAAIGLFALLTSIAADGYFGRPLSGLSFLPLWLVGLLFLAAFAIGSVVLIVICIRSCSKDRVEDRYNASAIFSYLGSFLCLFVGVLSTTITLSLSWMTKKDFGLYPFIGLWVCLPIGGVALVVTLAVWSAPCLLGDLVQNWRDLNF